MTQENKTILGSTYDAIETYFIHEYPVSTLLYIQIQSSTEVDNETVLNSILDKINETIPVKGRQISLNFTGSNGVYYSRTGCNNYTKFKIVQNQIKEFQKNNKDLKIDWIVSNPVCVPSEMER
jgi:hypothetical protein